MADILAIHKCQISTLQSSLFYQPLISIELPETDDYIYRLVYMCHIQPRQYRSAPISLSQRRKGSSTHDLLDWKGDNSHHLISTSATVVTEIYGMVIQYLDHQATRVIWIGGTSISSRVVNVVLQGFRPKSLRDRPLNPQQIHLLNHKDGINHQGFIARRNVDLGDI